MKHFCRAELPPWAGSWEAPRRWAGGRWRPLVIPVCVCVCVRSPPRAGFRSDVSLNRCSWQSSPLPSALSNGESFLVQSHHSDIITTAAARLPSKKCVCVCVCAAGLRWNVKRCVCVQHICWIGTTLTQTILTQKDLKVLKNESTLWTDALLA